MRTFTVVLTVFFGWLALASIAGAQDTNLYPVPPATKLEMLETNIGTIIIKGVSLVGSVAARIGTVDATVNVVCKADTETVTGQRASGLRIGVTRKEFRYGSWVVDYDEMDSLLKAIDDLSRINWTVTSLTSFDAVYTTRSGFCITATGLRRSGAIEYSLGTGPLETRIALSPDQWGQFRGLIDQAKRKLDLIEIQ